MKRGSMIVYVRRDDSRNGAPLVPASWELVEESSRWCTVYPLGRSSRDVFFHARLMVAHPTLARGVYVCVGQPAILSRLADLIAADALPWSLTWANLGELRADVRGAVQALRDAWPDERPEGDAGDVVRLFARMAGWQDDDGE